MKNSVAIINQQPNIQKKSHLAFLAMLGMFIMLIFIRAVVGISFPAVILLGWFSLTALMSDRDELLALCLVCIPTASTFQYKYALVVCMLVYAVKFNDDFKMNMCIIPVILMLVWELIHGLFYDLSLVEYFRDFIELIVLSFFMCTKKRDINYVFLCRVLGYTACIIGGFVLINVLRNNNYSLNALFDSGNYRFGVGNKEATQFGMNYNPNVLGNLCNIGIISLMLLRYAKKAILLDYAVILGLLVIGGLTISRTFILACAGVMAIFAFLGNKGGKGRIISLFVVGMLILVIWYVVATFLPSVYNSFVSRFSVNDITSGRSGLMDIYEEHIYSSWSYSLFGIGLYNVASKMNQIYGLVTLVPHNGFQEIVVVWGYPGLCMFISMILCMIHSAGKIVKKFCFANFIPLGFIMTVALAGQLITAGTKLLMLVFAYMILNVDFKKEET